MRSYVLGRTEDGQVHLFSDEARLFRVGLPRCQAEKGNRQLVSQQPVKGGDPQGEELTCNECKAILYGGRASDYD